MDDEPTEYGTNLDAIVLVSGMVDALKRVSWDETVPKFYRNIANEALKKLGQKR